ncbi:hypothetical protein CBP51_00265 [Cellvibrio mixtus]|uniref:DUF3999 domain-containing protein n=1 Tax=Cellvibrio mixtus TaxID=39650 RepID=A0A266Q6Q1_9GAMM|nr:DUF3999 family protein [Cellvibrio mixtus]OZY85522.1 hypothetical protein CBP51_00265 [Cellvibrio mixtus]
MSSIKKYLSIIGMALGCSVGFSALCSAEIIPVYKIDATTGSYIQTTLTHDIYRYSADAQLTDLVVTDQQGNKLPYRISASDTKVSVKTQQTPVRFFPVPVGASPETLLVLSSASIRLDDNEISVSVEKGNNTAITGQTAPTDFYVVDLSDLKTHADSLAILWPINDAHQYLEVEVSGTNDMTNWTPITNTTLVQLQKEGEYLTRNKIALNLSEMQYAYLRLKFTRGGDNLKLTSVHIENTHQIANTPAADTWEVQGTLAEKQDSAMLAERHTNHLPVAAWEFERDDIAPVNKISIDLGNIQYGDRITIFSRHSSKQPWQLVHQGIWFNAQVGSEWQRSDAVSIYSNSDTQWRVELNELVRTSAKPTLVFHRTAQTLQFIANNSAPYNIAIDNQTTTDHQAVSAQIFSQLMIGKDAQWESVTAAPLNPDLDSFARHQVHISWKTILFWLVLISAVGALVWVAVRLVGQMKHAQ